MKEMIASEAFKVAQDRLRLEEAKQRFDRKSYESLLDLSLSGN